MNALLPPIKASFEHDGQPVAGGFVYFYEPGTTTPKTTWSDALGSVPNANPVQLDSQGRATIFINGFYKVTVTSALGTVLYTVDNVSASPYQTLAVSEWITSGVTPTYLSATSFSVPGDYTSTFQAGRRIRSVDAGGTDYGWVKTAVFSIGITTVTVILDAGSLDAGLASVDVGIASVTNRSLPTEPVATKTDDYVLTAADVNKQFIFNKGTAVNFTLLAATAVPNGSLLRIKNIGAGVLTITGTIDGVASPTLTQYGEMVIYSDGAVWSRSAPAYVSAGGALRDFSATPAANTVPVSGSDATLSTTWLEKRLRDPYTYPFYWDGFHLSPNAALSSGNYGSRITWVVGGSSALASIADGQMSLRPTLAGAGYGELSTRGGGTNIRSEITAYVSFSDITSIKSKFGVANHTTGDTTGDTGIYFHYDPGINANFRCITVNSGTATATVTAVPPVNSVYAKLKIIRRTVASDGVNDVQFYINDSLVGTHTTNIPAISSNMGYSIHVGSALTRFMYSSFFSYQPW